MILGAGQCSNSAFSSANSSSWKARTGRGGGSTRKLIVVRSPSDARALAGADFGLVRPGLVVVDEVGPVFLGRGEHVELRELGRDGLCAPGPAQPVAERLAGRPVVGEAPHAPHGR